MGGRVTRLADIPIRIAPPSQPHSAQERLAAADGGDRGAGLGSGVFAIVAELTALLDVLVRRGEPGLIDLRSLPMSGPDRVALRRLLGDGEVKATFDADGVSRIDETGIAGVWWVEHRDRQGDIIAELIEVALFPPILSCAAEDLAPASRALEIRLAAAAAPAAAGERHDSRQ